MKVDTSRLKKGTSEVPPECQQLIDKLRNCTRAGLAKELAKVDTWTFGKCELFHWIDILDIFDTILEEATETRNDNELYLACDDFNEFSREVKLLHQVLNFTTLLIEHSFSRHLYNSVEHLTSLLSSSNMRIVLGVLNLLYMFSKRSNFISRLNSNKKNTLLCRLTYLAETWGGKEYGYSLAYCCFESMVIPPTCVTFYFEYYAPDGTQDFIHLPDIRKFGTDAREITNYICNKINDDVDEEKKMHIYTRISLAFSFYKYRVRLQFVQARLQALSVLVYSNALQESTHTLLYPGFLEELVELLEIEKPFLVEIRAAALRTLTSIIHLDRNPHFPKKPGSRLSMIIDVTGAGSYHGFLPILVRTCISNLINPVDKKHAKLFPLPLATALFSFLYHLASYEAGGEALVSCGMMESLLRVINWPGNELEHITFVTRAVRVIDLITNIDMQAFQSHGGLNSFISRLEMEVNLCRKEQPFEIQPQMSSGGGQNIRQLDDNDDIIMEDTASSSSTSNITFVDPLTSKVQGTMGISGKTCLPQRAALLKSMLNFLKKAIQDTSFSESIRHVMEGSLPSSLKHIISNAEYYGPSLFLLATDVVTVYVFQEPSLLSSLQDNGLTDVVLQALLKKDVPATREVLGSLPNVFSALCLNARGLASFVKYSPFDKLFRVLLSPVYLSAMRRRRSSDPMGDTASNLGNAMDELMRHQPSLKTEATKAIIKLLEDLVHLGTDPQYICWRAQNKSDVSPTTTTRQNCGGNGNDAGSSDEDEDDEEEASTSSHHNQRDINNVQDANADCLPSERTRIPLIDYILNVMKFIDAILSNNSTDDHCREFVAQGGLKPLLSILGLPNLPVDSPITTSAQAVAAICKSILNLAHESQVLQVSLEQLAVVVEQLKPLKTHLDIPGGSVLLRELANAPHIDSAFANANHTPLLHAVSAVHGYIVMLVHVCRTGQSEIRTLSLQKWGQKNEYGKNLLQNLVQLYTALVWESTLLLSLCTDDIIPTGCDFGKEDINKLIPNDFKGVGELCWDKMSPSCTTTETTETPSTSTGRPVTSPRTEAGITVEVKIFPTTIYTHTPSRLPPHLSTNIMDVDSPLLHYQGDTRHFQGVGILEHRRFYATSAQIKYIKSLLGASSRLGRALAELFGLLVKLCVGSPIRQRRGQNFPPAPSYTSEEAKDIARVLSYILVDGLSFNKLPPAPIPKLKLTFLICSVGFTSPMLFDEKRYAYHLMLQKFVEEGGLNAFFQMFQWALSAGYTLPLYHAIEYPNLPDGTGEFLDAWLMLLEKMVNPKAILESPNVITSKNSRSNKPEFDSLQYLITVHKHAYQSVMYLWGNKPLKTYGGRMSESILAILKHILKGDKIIKEKTRALAAERWRAKQLLYELGEPVETTSSAGPSGMTTTTSTSSSPRFLEALATYERSCITDSGNIPQPNPPESEAPPPLFPLFVPDQLQQLMDMGFTREHCQEALIHTTSIEQATDYLLNNPASVSAVIDTPNTSTVATGMDMDVSEDEQVIRAILMSLGENHMAPPPTTEFSPQIVAPPPPPPPIKFDKPSPLSKKTLYRGEEPLPDIVIKEFTDGALEKCLNLLDEVPETVYRVCDLLVTITKRNGEEWRDEMLGNLVARLSDLLDKYLNWMTPYSEDFVLRSEIMINGEMAARAAVILHLFTLLFEGQYQEMRVPCALAMGRFDILKKLVHVLLKYEKLMTHTQGRCGTPKWLAPLFLLIDLYEKVAVYTQRKRDMHGVTTRTWKWYDVASAKWNAYSVSNNKIINDAYWAGETSVRVSCGRQRYTINFNCMSQVNEETGNHRPVILALKATESKNLPIPLDWESPNFGFQVEEDTDPEDGSTSAPSDNAEKVTAAENAAREAIEKNMNVQLSGLDNMETAAIVLSCVRFMALPIDRDTLHAVMRVCLRLTRNHENAEIFAREGGVRLLLEMKQASAFIGFTTLATLLIRHVLEEPYTLGVAMSSVIGSRTLPTIPPGYKELLYMTRQMSSAVSRNPKIFKSVAQQMLRIDINVLRRNPVTEDQRLLLKSIQPTNCRPYSMSEKIAIQVIQELLHSLIVPVTYNITPPVSPTNASAPKTNVSVPTTTVTTGITNIAPIIGGNPLMDLTDNQSNPLANVTNVNIPNSSGITSASCNAQPSLNLSANISNTTQQSGTSAFSRIQTPNSRGTTGKTWSSTPTSKGEYEKPLLPKSAVLKILSDAVRSYNTVAILITEHVFKPTDSSNLITEPISALSFILDKLLPVNEMNPDRDCSTMARMLIAALASCSEVATAQYAVVAEVKQALARSLCLPESADKHNQIQLLAALIPTMIENCPPDSPALLKLHHYQPRRNGVFYTMVRKGLITDLAKVTQNLDLSSPHTVATVNAVLKPLETLLRMTNQPVPTNNANKTKKGPSATVSSNTTRTSRGSETQISMGDFGLSSGERSGRIFNTTSSGGTHPSAASDATNAQDEPIPDDSENTEHDISAAVDSLIERTNEAQVQVNLEEIMGHFLERDNQMDIVEDVVERVTDALTGLSGSGGVGTRNNIDQLDSYNVRDPTLDTSSESGDSDSNASENDEREIDEDDDNEEEAEELSEIDVDEETRQFIEMYDHHVYGRHLSPIIPEMARDNEGIARDILMINYRNHRSGTPDVQDGNGGDSVSSAAGGTGNGTNNSTNTTSTSSGPIAVTSHPLLRGVRTVNNSPGVTSQAVQSVQSSQQTQPSLLVQQSIELPGHSSSGSRAQRTSTSSRPRRYQYLNINTRNSNLPVLQRLLGPGSQNIVTANQATGNSNNTVSNNSTNSANGTSATHVILMNNGFRIYSNGGEDDPIDLLDQAGYLFGRSLAATLSNTPSALHWWIEEAKVLGLESQSDVCLTVCDSLIPELDNFKSQELAKTRGKRKKKQAEQTDEDSKQKSQSSTTPFANIRMGLDINSLQQSLDNMQQTEDPNALNTNEFYSEADIDGTTFRDGSDGIGRRHTHVMDNVQRAINSSQLSHAEEGNDAINTDDSSDNESLGSSRTIQPRTIVSGANQGTQTNTTTLSTQTNTGPCQYPGSGNSVNIGSRGMLYNHPIVPLMRVRELLDQHLNLIESGSNITTEGMSANSNSDIVSDSEQEETQGMDSDSDSPQPRRHTHVIDNVQRSTTTNQQSQTEGNETISTDDSSDNESLGSSRTIQPRTTVSGANQGTQTNPITLSTQTNTGSCQYSGTGNSVNLVPRVMLYNHPIVPLMRVRELLDQHLNLIESGSNITTEAMSATSNSDIVSDSEPEETQGMDSDSDSSQPRGRLSMLISETSNNVLTDLINQNESSDCTSQDDDEEEDEDNAKDDENEPVANNDVELAVPANTNNREANADIEMRSPPIANVDNTANDRAGDNGMAAAAQVPLPEGNDTEDDDEYFSVRMRQIVENQLNKRVMNPDDIEMDSSNSTLLESRQQPENTDSKTTEVSPESRIPSNDNKTSEAVPVPVTSDQQSSSIWGLNTTTASTKNDVEGNDTEDDDEYFSVRMRQIVDDQLKKRIMNKDDTDMDSSSSTLLESGDKQENLDAGEPLATTPPNDETSDIAIVPVTSGQQSSSVWRINATSTSTQNAIEGAIGGSLNAVPDITVTTTNVPPILATTVAIPEPTIIISNTGTTDIRSNAETGEDDILLPNVSGNREVPEGIDPSFLEALPDDMREEVIVEHLRTQRIRQRAQQNAIQNEHAAIIEVNPEFLAALPPNIQEEVLAQQRIEQQRVAASTTNPNDPVDAAAFFQNLQPSLRQAILTDMEDSQISVLPPDIAAEAQNLRRDWENRNRQIMQERLLSQLNTTTASFSSVLRYRSRVPGPRFSNFTRTRWSQWQASNSGDEMAAQTSTGLNVPSTMERQGRALLDHEAIASLLVLLFIDEPKFNTLRLHRVIRNLCFHVPTREWVIKSLLSIIERSNEQSSAHLHQQVGVPPYSNFRPEWLNIRLDAALGCRANIFLIKRSPVPGVTIISPTPVSIHPQAAPIVCRHTLDLLISLAKSFPIHFLPLKSERKQTNLKREDQPGPSSGAPYSPDFWDILVRLDSAAQRRNCFTTKSMPRSGRECPDAEIFLNNTTFDSSPFGQLISMLSYDIVKKSCQLTDKLLRLLSFISIGLPEEKQTSTVNESSGNSSLSSLVVAARSSLNASSTQRNATTTTNNISGNTAAEAATARLRIAASLEEHSYLETEKLLHLSIEVLTSKACSEEGLEDATSLLLNLSQCSPRTRTVILKLLIQGAYALAKTVQSHIANLIKELKNLHSHHVYYTPMTNTGTSASSMDSSMKSADHQIPGSSSGSSLSGLHNVRPTKGVLRDRFTKENVVITAPSKVKATCDLQLPSMGPLVSKSSSQAFFLRILKVIIQIRESVKEALKRDISTTSSANSTASSQSGTATGGTPMASSAIRTGAMPKRSIPSTIVAINAELAPLSETLLLDTLWDTLSECLLQLEETPDHHAVLVLQPAVEAFFLVHAASQSKEASQNQQPTNVTVGVSTDENTQTTPLPPPARGTTASQTSSDMAPVSPIMLFNITTNPSIRPSERSSIENIEPDNNLALSGSSSTSSSIGLLTADTVIEDSQISDITKSSDQNKLASLIQCQSASALADQKKFLQFAEKHRTVLNQILRQTTTHLADGPFAVLVDHTRILDFDVKRRYFRTELERLDEGIRREELAVHVHRKTVFEDSFRELYRRNPEEWKNRFYIVFEDEEGQDAGGLLREWYVIISREIFNPNYALFTVSPGDRVTYMINPSSHANPNHLCYYKFVGRVIAKAIYDNKLLECYFTRSFYKHILGIQVKHTDMESEDYDFYKGLVFLMENRVSSLGYELTFSLEVQEFGVTEIRDLIKNGRNIPVTEDNKLEYIHLVCQLKMNGSIRQQLNAFLEGFYDIIPKRLISIFNEQELELLISGLPNVDIEDLRTNTEYHKYLANSIQIQWFWRALRSFDQAERAKFLQFVTGTSKVPLQGFAALEGMNGTQKFQIHLDDRSTDRLPSAHTCFNQLDLPVYKTYDKLRASLLKAIHECSEGFGFA